MPYYRWSLVASKPIPGYPRELKHIGDHLLKRRLDLSLQQRTTATRLGVTPSGLENWEHGRTHPATRFYPRIIEFLGYNPLPERMGVTGAYARKLAKALETRGLLKRKHKVGDANHFDISEVFRQVAERARNG